MPNNQAQDLLNVEITDQGKSVRKRKGLGLSFTLPIATSAVHGIYSFYDGSGNDVSLFFNDRYLSGSVNGAAATTIFSTGTVGATWQCTDSLGYAYCASTAREPVIKTNGVTATQLYMTSTGTMVTATTERLATAGFSGAPSQINLSGANDFTNWTLGGEPTSPYNETINAPGSRITHITYACNGLMWFKETSFGIILNPDDALAAHNVILAPEIGTLDNTSIQYPGGLQFRAQDGHIYNYDCSGIEKLTRDITPTINTSGSRASNAWTQTTASDWSNGTGILSGSFSTSIVSGDVVLSSFTATDTASSDFIQGAGSNMTFNSSNLIISTNAVEMSNNSFESGIATNWSLTGTDSSGWVSVASESGGACGCSISPKDGSFFTSNYYAGDTSVSVVDDATGVGIATTTVTWASGSCTWAEKTITVPSNYLRKRIKVRVRNSNGDILTSDSFISNSADVKFWSSSNTRGGTCLIKPTAIDLFHNTPKSSILTSNFTSRTSDTGVTKAILYPTANWTVNTSTPYVELQSSTDGLSFQKVTSSTGTNVTTNRYVRYISSFTVGSSESANSTLDDVSFVAKSTGGVFLSAVKNAPSLTSWDTFIVTRNTDGGTQTFYTRASTGSFTITSSTPLWVAQTAGSVVSASTGTYFQVRDDFATTYATSTLSLSDFIINWFEGSASDKAYGIYFGKDNALWWSVPVGSGQSTNNRILRWDLINRGWVLYDIPSNGFLIRNQNLYVGSSSAGKVYKYGDTDSDDNVAINSYWKSKDFSGDSPTIDKEFRTLSVIAKSVASSSMTVTYTLNGSSATAYTVPLYNSSSTIQRKNRYLPAGRVGNTFNVQFGNNAADQYWELFGASFGYKPIPWRVE